MRKLGAACVFVFFPPCPDFLCLTAYFSLLLSRSVVPSSLRTHASFRQLVSDGVGSRKANAHLHTQQPHIYTHRAHRDQQDAGRRNQA